MLLESISGEAFRRTAEMAKVLNDAGLITLVSHDLISAGELETAREIIGGKGFIEVNVDEIGGISTQDAAKSVVKRVVRPVIARSPSNNYDI